MVLHVGKMLSGVSPALPDVKGWSSSINGQSSQLRWSSLVDRTGKAPETLGKAPETLGKAPETGVPACGTWVWDVGHSWTATPFVWLFCVYYLFATLWTHGHVREKKEMKRKEEEVRIKKKLIET